ncbi:MAG: 4-hydroxy-3-methylbut-2-enyl diphosphate reductase [Lentisphaeria bacterium]|nr:4-hydroxy-3-methylbut-2-enyl diphosphate reductase [Lentisphaeria bacterium]
MMKRKTYLPASVHGMCGGVFAALRILDEFASARGEVYVFRELVHNRAVTADLAARGVRFVDKPDDIPDGAAVVIGAHGVGADLERELRRKAAVCRDATCPLVKKLHRIAAALTPEEQLVICGKSGHPEVRGIAGNSGTPAVFIVGSAAEVAALPELSLPVFLSQTTVDHAEAEAVLAALKRRFPQLTAHSGVCDASRKRQEAVLELAGKCELVLVIGSPHSSNARRLQEIAARQGAESFLIDSAAELPLAALDRVSTVGVTSGASTPEHLFAAVTAALERLGFSCAGAEASGTPNT